MQFLIQVIENWTLQSGNDNGVLWCIILIFPRQIRFSIKERLFLEPPPERDRDSHLNAGRWIRF